jgi:hypothetical protein
VRVRRGPSPPTAERMFLVSGPAATGVRSDAAFTAAEVLLRPVPSSVTSRTATGGPLVAATAGPVCARAAAACPGVGGGPS